MPPIRINEPSRPGRYCPRLLRRNCRVRKRAGAAILASVRRQCAGARFEYPKSYHAGPHSVGAGRGLGDHVGRDAYCLSPVPGRRDQRRRRRLPRQALPHGERARRLSRSAGRQGADRVDLCFARHCRRAADLSRHSGRVARYHDHQRLHAVLAGRQADADPAAVGLQSQYGGADRACRSGPGRTGLRFRRRDRRRSSPWRWSRS